MTCGGTFSGSWIFLPLMDYKPSMVYVKERQTTPQALFPDQLSQVQHWLPVNRRPVLHSFPQSR